MRVLRIVAMTLGSLGLVALSTLPAQAADATTGPGSGEIAAGYSYLYDSTSSTSIPAGWFLSAGANIGDTFAIVGDISGNYKSDSTTVGTTTVTTSANLHTFMAGPRVTGRSGQLGFYGQFLVGAARGSGSFTASGGGTSLAVSASNTEFCFAPGAGVDFNLGEHSTFRAGVSERLIHVDTGTTTTPASTFQKEFQLQIGLVYRFGN